MALATVFCSPTQLAKSQKFQTMPKNLKKAKREIEEDEDEDVSHSKKSKKKEKNVEDEGEGKEEMEAVYLPGQKHDRPSERDPLRIFFETLYHQLPDSKLAATWMMEWGLLPPEEATTIYKMQLKKNKVEETSQISNQKADKISLHAVKKTNKRKISENSSNADSIVSKKMKKQKELPIN